MKFIACGGSMIEQEAASCEKQPLYIGSMNYVIRKVFRLRLPSPTKIS